VIFRSFLLDIDTHPLNPDSDNDGLSDGDERFGAFAGAPGCQGFGNAFYADLQGKPV
jgi:hypothetical protein